MQRRRASTLAETGLALVERWTTFRTVILRQKFLRDVGVLTVANGVSAILSFVQGLLLAHWLGPAQFGAAALVMSYPTLLFTLFDSRSSAVTIKFLGEFHTQGKERQALAMCQLGYVIDAAIAVLTWLLVAATAWWAEAYIMHTSGVAPLMVVYALAFVPRAAASTSGAALSALGRFPLLAWVDVLTTVLRVAVGLGLVINEWGIAGVIWGNVVGMVASGVLLAVAASQAVKNAWGASWLSASWGALRDRRMEIFHLLLWTNCSELLGLVVKQLDLVLLSYFRGPQEVGYYKLAKSLASLVGNIVGPLESVAYPRLAALIGAHQHGELRQTIRLLAFRIGLPAGVIAGAGLWLVPWALPHLAGSSFTPAISLAQLLLACGIVWLTGFWLRPLYFAQGFMKRWTLISGGVAGASLIGLPTCTYLWGGVGMAAWQLGTTLASYSALTYLAIHTFQAAKEPIVCAA